MESLCKDDSTEHYDKLLLQHIAQGNNAQVLFILKNISPHGITDNSGDTPLHFAVKYGNKWLVRHLIDLGANVNAQNHSKETPLTFAIQYQKIKILKLLLKANANIFVPDVNAKCALRKAFDNARPIVRIIPKGYNNYFGDSGENISENILKLLLDRVTIESLNNSRRLDSKEFHTDCPLYIFMSLKSPEITRILLEKGSGVNAQHPETGDSSLHIAVEKMDIDNVKLLLEYNADVNMKNLKGKTPLACLSYLFIDKQKMLAISNTLVAAGADLIDYDRREILVHYTLLYGNKEMIRSVLKHPIELHFIDKLGQLPLYFLAKNKNPDVLEELSGFDFDVNIRTSYWRETMLHCAVSEGNVSSIRYLLNRGANIDAVCSRGNTPLARIFAGDINDYVRPFKIYAECVEVLLAQGADPRIVTNNNHQTHLRWLNGSLSAAYLKLMLPKPLLIHLSALEASGQDIGIVMKNEIQANPQFREIFDSKKVELEEMKLIKLGRSVTLLDFVVASKKDISLYARHRRVMLLSLSAVEKDSLDPCYQRKLYESSLEFDKLIELRKKSAVVLDEIFGELYGIPVYDIAEKIVDYLDDHELGNLLGTIS